MFLHGRRHLSNSTHSNSPLLPTDTHNHHHEDHQEHRDQGHHDDPEQYYKSHPESVTYEGLTLAPPPSRKLAEMIGAVGWFWIMFRWYHDWDMYLGIGDPLTR